MHDLGFEAHEGYQEIEQGFIDHHNNFLDRKEALEHAYECGQLSSKIYHDKKEGSDFSNLISEDLW